MTPPAPPASGTVRTALEPMHPREEPAAADIPVDTPPGAPRKNHRALRVGLGLGATLLLLQTLYALGGLLQQSPVLGMAWSVVFVLVLGAGGRAAWGMWRKLRRLRFQRDMRTRVQELLVHNGLSEARNLCDQLATEAGQLQSPAYLRWRERLEDTHNDREVLRLYGRMVLAEADTRALERVSSHAGDVAVMVADIRGGRPVEVALRGLAVRSGVRSVQRFVDGIVVALERGTPLADVVRAQAEDARTEERRRLVESAGRKDVSMLIPVVFLVLPTVVLVALFPGVQSLRLVIP